jgi:hypothetical protein
MRLVQDLRNDKIFDLPLGIGENATDDWEVWSLSRWNKCQKIHSCVTGMEPDGGVPGRLNVSMWVPNGIRLPNDMVLQSRRRHRHRRHPEQRYFYGSELSSSLTIYRVCCQRQPLLRNSRVSTSQFFRLEKMLVRCSLQCYASRCEQ